MSYWTRRRNRKHLQALLHHAHALRNLREDVLPAADLVALDAAMDAAEAARRGRDEAPMDAAAGALAVRLDALSPPGPYAGWRENFEVLVVALGVAMAFRAYFYQPFQIPTGSMQPTLYGISSEERAAPRLADRMPLNLLHWVRSGEWYRNLATRRPGRLAVVFGDDRKPGFTTLISGRWNGALPRDVPRRDPLAVTLLRGLGDRAGLHLFDRGYDFLFVPSDAIARHAGVLGAAFHPPVTVARDVAVRLRQAGDILDYAAAEGRDGETRALALNRLQPLLAALSNGTRLGEADPQLNEALTYLGSLGPGAVPSQDLQHACRLLGPLLHRWADAADGAANGPVPWMPLLTGLDVELPAGTALWSGVVRPGDFVFVNRWAWNLRRPRRGEVMVFATAGIHGLPQGTHYIKRMCGLPGETLSIRSPDLLIDGTVVRTPHSIARVAGKEQLAPWAPPYAGYQTVGEHAICDDPRALRNAGDAIRLGPDEYFAMGDNTGNSRDSRYWGPVPERNLLGPATVVYWPFSSRRWGWIE